jgi:uncharacterized protein YjbJ (UPF0337 family)
MAEKSNSQRDPDQIQQDIDQTRANMTKTIDALEAKLNPERLKTEASKTIRRQTVGRAEDFADNASRTVQGASADVFETIKQNPLPAALAAIGLGWLIMESRNDNRSNTARTYPMPGRYGPEYRYYSGRERSGPYGRTDWQTTDQSQGAGSPLQQKAGQVAGQAQEKMGQVTDQAQEKLGQVTDQAQETFGQVSDQVGQWTDAAQEQAYRVKSRLAQTLDENPLLIGAVAVALGAAIGLSLPRTPQEDQMMGQVRDNLMDKAQATASDTMQKVQQVAQQAGNAAKDAARNEAQRQDLTSS